MSQIRVAVDIGGTFTDLVHFDAEAGAVGVAKAATTPGRFEDGVMDALGEADLDGAGFVAHGTTVIINALTERKGATTALITTRGFRDVLEIQRANRPDLYNLLDVRDGYITVEQAQREYGVVLDPATLDVVRLNGRGR